MNHLLSIKYLLTVFAISAGIIGYSQQYSGTVIRVIDGDTFVFQTEEGSVVVRMEGTDAPERDQPFAGESTDFLKQYLNRKAVLRVSGTDRYGRTIGTLHVNKRDINLLSVKKGFAWHYKQYSSDKKYSAAEEYARKRKKGLWSIPDPVPPWKWRKK
ncbi:MAG: nuclease [Bacteroidales bacterium]|jgi:endonuclease YncB( thermonuclease family)|nr:nuclease [Bacteroidales bacterium]